MKKPSYMEDLLSIIFGSLGILYIFVGILCFLGMVKPKASSMIQEPSVIGTVFSVLGLIFLMTSFVLIGISRHRRRLCSELITNGIKINGKILQIYLQRYVQYGNRSPYRIVYTYSYQGKDYQQKSCFLWEKPDHKVGDTVVVYVNDFGKSVLSL